MSIAIKQVVISSNFYQVSFSECICSMKQLGIDKRNFSSENEKKVVIIIKNIRQAVMNIKAIQK